MTTAYAVHITDNDPCWLYLIDVPRGEIHTPQGEALVPLPQRHWYAGPDALKYVFLIHPQKRTVTGWKLKEGVTVDGWPNALTPVEYDEHDPYGDAPAPELRLYEQEVTLENVIPTQVDLTLIDVAALSLEERPLTWRANLPYAAKEHPQLRPAFPGCYIGVRKWLEDQIKHRRNIQFCFLATSRERYATVLLALDPSQHQPAKGRKRSKNYRRAVTSRALRIDLSWIPDEVKGDNADDAWANVEQIRDDALAAVDITGTICPHCDGSGIIAEVTP